MIAAANSSYESRTLFGFLVVDKPHGITSRHAVDMVKKLVRPAKIGHAGTLDPLATGVLVTCIGPATRLTQFVQQMPKTYIGEFRLGVKSVTDDTESELQEVDSAPIVTRSEIESVLPGFKGDILQTPPNYSAVKIGGKRAYALSRAGKEVEIKPRPVTVHEIEILQFEYPNLKLKICCGSGTYIRSIGRDLGATLNSGAVMTALRRTAIGDFTLEQSIDCEGLNLETLQKNLVAPLASLPGNDRVVLTADQVEKLQNGHIFSRDELQVGQSSDIYVAVDSNSKLLAMLSPHHSGGLRPELNFVSYYY